jgi:thymidine kinase
MLMAKLYFRYGAMNSSKTANALMVKFNYEERQQNVLLMKPSIDDRDGKSVIKSRAGLSEECLLIPADMDIYKEIKGRLPEGGLHCLIIDEAQFLTRDQVYQLTRIVDDLRVPVVCYGLRSDFVGNLFEGSQWLLAWADTIEEIKTICWCGKKAIMNARLKNGRVTKQGDQIELGGNERYISLCREHWHDGLLG